MYYYQKATGKLYVQNEDKLVGVDFCSDKTLMVKGTEIEISTDLQPLSLYEVRHKFQIIEGKDYKFPREKTEVVTDEPIEPVKKPARKSTRK